MRRAARTSPTSRTSIRKSPMKPLRPPVRRTGSPKAAIVPSAAKSSSRSALSPRWDTNFPITRGRRRPARRRGGTRTRRAATAVETCGNCGYTTYAEIPALDHNYVGGVCTRCGVADPDAQPAPGGTESLLEFTFNGTSYALTGIGAHSDPHVVIPSEFHGYPVTEIGGRAFADRHWITEVTIPDSVTIIGDSAFRDCSSLTSIVIPDSVTSIGDGAFDNTAYYNDENNRENGVLYIGKYLIDAKTTISGNHEIREGTLIIAYGAFSDCSNLTSIVIPDSVTSIGSQAFMGCSSLTSIVIPDSVTSIGSQAFRDCSSLTGITIPDSVTSIGMWTFYGCSSLTSIVIPDSVTIIGWGAFEGCSSLTSIAIPDSVTSIGDGAFCGCSSLTSIVIPDSVTSIGSKAFMGCSSLTSIAIPDSVTSIGSQAFRDCSSLTSIAIPDSVTSIGSQAFRDCSSLTSIAIPDSVTSIGNEAFYGCGSSLTSILVAEGNKVYHSAGNCLIVTANKTLILGCSTSVIPVDGSVTSIGDGAFYGCSSLTSIAIPDSVTSIGDGAFHGCSSLTSILVAEGNKVYHSAGNCLIETASKTLILGCSTSLIPVDGSVTSIGDGAFYGCSSLTSIAIPDSVTSIGRQAFHGCDNLETVYYTGTEEEWAAIEIGTWNDVLYRADIICNYTGE